MDESLKCFDERQSSLAAFDREPHTVHKFGGSSLSTRSALLKVSQIISGQIGINDLVVVSANGKITDDLVAYAKGDRDALSRIVKYYRQLTEQAIDKFQDFLCSFDTDVEQLKSCQLSENEVLAFGEVWSARLLVALLNQLNIPALFVDAREILVTDSIENHQSFRQNEFEENLARLVYGNYGKRLIITGFIASGQTRETLTLGRNGSDYSATLIAALVGAKKVNLWTDVSGIFTADPKLVPRAQPVSDLNYEEANELAKLGTNVLHLKTLSPITSAGIPVLIKSTFKPELPGTCIGGHFTDYRLNTSGAPVKSIALKSGLVKLKVALKGYLDVVDLESRLFEKHVNLIQSEPAQKQGYVDYLVCSQEASIAGELLDSLELEYSFDSKCWSMISIIGVADFCRSELCEQLRTKVNIQFDDAYRDSTSDRFSPEKSKLLVKNLEGCSSVIRIIVDEESAVRLLDDVYSICFDASEETNANGLEREFSKPLSSAVG